MPRACLRHAAVTWALKHLSWSFSSSMIEQHKFTKKLSRFISDDSDICQGPMDCCCQQIWFFSSLISNIYFKQNGSCSSLSLSQSPCLAKPIHSLRLVASYPQNHPLVTVRQYEPAQSSGRAVTNRRSSRDRATVLGRAE